MPDTSSPSAETADPGGAGNQPLLRRLWIYQAERFPLATTAVSLAVFCAAGINVTALLAGTALPGTMAYAVAWVASMVVFFQMRVCDEHKDHAIDCRYRPERPVPRGLISLRTLRGLGLLGIPPAAALVTVHEPILLVILAVVWIWLGLMTVEFFVPAWLKARPLPYLVSHMLILPLIALLVTACAWAIDPGKAPDGLAFLLILAFLNGIVLEIGRKVRAPANEREDVETYSATWGVRPATGIWLLALLTAAVLCFALSLRLGAVLLVGPIVLVGMALALFAGLTFSEAPDTRTERRMDRVSRLWVLLSYAALAAAPLAVDG